MGTDVPKQSLYENNHRGLRAPYLSRIAEVGVDVLYVLTGRRSEACLDESATAFLAGYFELPAEFQQAVERLMADLRKLAERVERGG